MSVSTKPSDARRLRLRIAAAAVLCLAACQLPVSYPDGVIVETVKYEKTAFFRGPAMNLVSDLRQGDFDGDGSADLLAVGADGAHILGPDGREKRVIAFRAPEPPWAASVLAGPGASTPRVLANLPQAAQTVVFDETGAVAWKSPGEYFGSPIAADLDGDGRVEVLSMTAAGIDVRGLDGSPIRQLTAAGKPLQFDCADMDGDGRAEIVTGNWENGGNQIAVFSADGRQLARWTSPHVFNRFSLVTPPGGTRPELMVLSDSVEELAFLDMHGKVTRTLKAPWGNKLSQARGMSLRVAGEAGGFVSLGTSKGSRHHHVTYVYNARGDLVYADSADDDAQAVLALTGMPRDLGAGAFLVGSRSVIWKYAERR